VVEDDADRESIDGLIRATGYRTSVFDSGEAFLRSYHQRIDCLILDEHLPGLSGLRLQGLLADAHIAMPIVFVTARMNAVRTQALAKGALAVLEKPFTDKELLMAVTSALPSAQVD
jgi:FixJ family two-component response regulator